MKRKKWKLVPMLAAFTLLVGSLVACSGKNTNSTASDSGPSNSATASSEPSPSASKLDPVVIKMMLWGDKPAGMDDVLAEFERRTKDTLNMKLDITWTPLSDYANKLKMKLAAGEEVDVAFDAQWLQLIQFIGQNNYANLDNYFNNDQYPGLKKAFSDELVNNNKFNGHVFGVPFLQGYAEINGFYIRKDLREKYGLPPLKNLADLEAYFAKVKENEPGMVPLAENGSGATWSIGFSENNNKILADANVFSTSLAGTIMTTVKLSSDLKKVEQMTFLGEPNGETILPEGNLDVDLLSRSWYTKGYFEKDVISQKDKLGMFKVGKAASIAWDTANFNIVQMDLQKNVPGAQMELFVTNEAARNKQEKAIQSEFKAWNFACIPVTSKKIDRTMMFFDWLFSSQENHDLFEYGIEGKNWSPNGDDRYSVGADQTAFVFPGYQLSWNPIYIRYPSEIDNDILEYLKYRTLETTYYKSALAGFNFNTEPVKTEVAKVGPVYDEISKLMTVGMMSDPDKAATTAYEKAMKLGLGKIKEEAKKQIEAFLATQP